MYTAPPPPVPFADSGDFGVSVNALLFASLMEVIVLELFAPLYHMSPTSTVSPCAGAAGSAHEMVVPEVAWLPADWVFTKTGEPTGKASLAEKSERPMSGYVAPSP